MRSLAKCEDAFGALACCWGDEGGASQLRDVLLVEVV